MVFPFGLGEDEMWLVPGRVVMRAPSVSQGQLFLLGPQALSFLGFKGHYKTWHRSLLLRETTHETITLLPWGFSCCILKTSVAREIISKPGHIALAPQHYPSPLTLVHCLCLMMVPQLVSSPPVLVFLPETKTPSLAKSISIKWIVLCLILPERRPLNPPPRPC